MPLKWQVNLVILGAVITAIIANFITLSNPIIDNYELAERLFAVNGYIAISFATIMTPLFRLGGSMTAGSNTKSRSLKRLHYMLAALGLACATAHPIAVAIRDLTPQVFLPNFNSWAFFWANAGRPALLVLYIAFFAALLNGNIKKYWRHIHALMYLVLFLVIIHANLLGTDFKDPAMSLLFDLLFVASISAFLVRRIQSQHKTTIQ